MLNRRREKAAFDYHAAAWSHVSDMLIWADADTGRILDANPQAERLLGRTREELLGLRYLDLHPHDQRGRAQANFASRAKGEITPSELDIVRADGQRVPVEIRVRSVATNGQRMVLGSLRDLTERQAARRETARHAAALGAIHQAMLAAMEAESDRDLMTAICQGIIAEGAYGLAFVGLANDDEEQTITIAAMSGDSHGYLADLQLAWGDTPLGNGPTGSAIRFGSTQIVNRALENVALMPWAERLRHFEVAAMISVPLLENARQFGALTIYAKEPDVFGDIERSLFEDLARQLVLGIRVRRERIAYFAQVEQNALQTARTRDALEQTIGTVTATIEQRDPYTAGHSRGVAELSERIASRLGFPAERNHGIYLAGLVHDVGKIRIPAEILSKPGSLSNIEYALLQSHAEVGYEILHGVDFPWPIAEMTYQHHERMDGSGYPRGLQGDEVLVDARIVAVADMVESMCAHRPYRPALGMEQTVAELQRQRGTKLDADVVEAALLELQ